MTSTPFEIGILHFVGIGGIGMSGIAEVMHNLGYAVQGSDISDNPNVKRLRSMGIPVQVGHAPENLQEASVIITSSAVKADNPEVVAAREKLIPVVRRAEMLAELMRLKWCIAVAGTHGKTTTTSMMAAILDQAQMDATVINGGIINAYGSNARMGDGDWMVVEADESDGTFVSLPATIAICTNLDPEHLDHYGDFDALKDAFRTFMTQIPFYGFAVACIDDPDVQTLIAKITDRRIISYGVNPQADVRLEDLTFDGGTAKFNVVISGRSSGERRELNDMVLPMPGEHNVLNAVAAIAVAHELGLSDDVVRQALKAFGGVKRRFTKTGEWNGVTIIDDYGHHPAEISAVLKAARSAADGKVHAVIQPHRYSRLRDLFDDFCKCFNDADSVIVSEVYEAGETPIEGISRDALVEGIRNHGHRDVLGLGSPGDLAHMISASAEPGDYVVCLGAGTITNWANALPQALADSDRSG